MYQDTFILVPLVEKDPPELMLHLTQGMQGHVTMATGNIGLVGVVQHNESFLSLAVQQDRGEKLCVDAQ